MRQAARLPAGALIVAAMAMLSACAGVGSLPTPGNAAGPAQTAAQSPMPVAPAAQAAASRPAWRSAQALRITSRDGTPITGWWLSAQEPVAAPAPQPVVVLLHGCGGLYSTLNDRAGQLTQRHGGFADRLRAEGWHVVLPDSLTARGERSLCEQPLAQRRVHQAHRRDDVLGTLAWLAQQPWADAARVAVVGWSHGGSAVLASTDLSDPLVRAHAQQPRIALAFYPGCSEALRRSYRPSAPLVMLLGEKDDWTPAEPCVRLGAAVGARVTVYPDSHHGFDSPTGRVQHLPNVPNGANPGRGVHAGRNPVTGPQAWNDAISLLRATLAPGKPG